MLIPSFIEGRLIDMFKLRPEHVHVEDIANTLAKINRYNGRTPHPYSVAQHAVFVSYLCPLALEGLHHDDTEAYLGDVSSPVKRLLPLFGRIEERMRRRAIAPAFGLSADEPAMVKWADVAALRMEQVFIQGRKDVPFPEKVIEWDRVRELLRPMHWTAARDAYLERHWELYGVEDQA
jgi:hypothetical protein